MTSRYVEYPNIRVALERARLFPLPRDLAERLDSACEHPEIDPADILEITKADWGTEEQSADDVLVVQTRTGVFIIVKVKGGFLRPSEMGRIRCLYEWYEHVVEDDEMAGSSVAFYARPGHHHFLLSFARADERDRMFRCLFEAHAGHFARWGLQLDPADYAADFDRYYAQLCANGPQDTRDLSIWIEREYGEFDRCNALGLAVEWRQAELEEHSGRQPAARVSQLRATALWHIEEYPEARAVVLRLGAQLFDEGRLGPPYDEHTFTDEPISHHDAGPKRLLLLMTLAALARTARHPRADEWVAAARVGIPVLPGSVFPDALRALWSDVEELPPAAPPREIPIWEDVDVGAITAGDVPDVIYSVESLAPNDRALVTGFLEALEASSSADAPSAFAVLHTCLTGVTAFEDLSPQAPPGWRKFLVYFVSDQAYMLWHEYQLAEPSGRLAQWVMVTIEANGWGPDGRQTPLGQHHSWAMGIAGESGVGIVEIDPDTQLAKAPTGEAARNAARAGHF